MDGTGIECAAGCRLASVESVANLSIASCSHVYNNLAPLSVAVDADVYIVQVLGIVVAESVVQVGEADESVGKVVVVLQLWLCPLHFAQCSYSWQSHILHVLECRHILGPDVCLNTDDVTSLVSSQFLRHRLVRIYTLQGQIATDGKRLVSFVE